MAHDHRPSEDACPLEMLDLDPFETGLLSVLRHLLTAFSRPETQAWQTGFSIATERWGIARGPQIAQCLLSVVQALRQARQSDFRFANPLCPDCRTWATGEEAAFCRMLQAMRRDRPDLARPAVMDLAEGVMDPVLIQAGLAFAARFPAEGGDLRPMPAAEPHPRPTARHLRLVH
ncbi:hypothetical protein [Neotabrizicola sp. VNH66]|uniref:hypothetical protein n=1 Tax=Neotabrizicola sp. VNH66 TaxID=3400918 RepID=UPI003C0FEBEF